jgi:hypothetical protein
MRRSLALTLSLTPLLLLGGSVEVRQDTVDGQAVSTMNDNFRRLDKDKLDKKGVKDIMITGTVNIVVPTVDITVSTPTITGQLVQTPSHVIYVATNTTNLAGWVKVGSQ